MALDPTRRPVAGARVPATEVAVTWLQRQLNSALPDRAIAVDGVVGPQTEAALRAYVVDVLRQPITSPTIVAQVSPTDRTRIALSTQLEAALASAQAEGGGMLMPLVGVAAVAAAFYFYAQDKTPPRRSRRGS